MINSVFGKPMENVKNRIDLGLTTNEEHAIQCFSTITFKKAVCVNNLYMIEAQKKKYYMISLYMWALLF